MLGRCRTRTTLMPGNLEISSHVWHSWVKPLIVSDPLVKSQMVPAALHHVACALDSYPCCLQVPFLAETCKVAAEDDWFLLCVTGAGM